jgi:disulfide bond formation protein DsbB
MLTSRQSATIICLVMLTTIVGAWIFEYAGYPPCELCLKQRWAYYAIVPLTAYLAAGNPRWIKTGLLLALVILLASMVFGIYHSGVEWKFWAGPQTCSGGSLAGGLPDLTKAVVKCDEPALRIFGISLAGYNALISAAMAFVAWRGARA